MGLPGLSHKDRARVEMDNSVTEFVLDLIEEHARRNGASIRENPARSLHCGLPTEVRMMKTGMWRDTEYHACSLGGARKKHQRLRHNVDEIAAWPNMACQHLHQRGEWSPQETGGHTYWPSEEEAEYTAALAYAIAVSASWLSACRA